VLSLKIAVGDVSGNLFAAACSQAQNHAQSQQQGQKLLDFHILFPLPLVFLVGLFGFCGGFVVLFEDATFHDAVILSIESSKTFVKAELEVPFTFIYLHKR
jgi:hypothetical protein